MAELDDLQRLAEMRDKGDLSQEEYEQLKAKLLSGPTPATQAKEAPASTATDQMKTETRWWLVGTGVLMGVGSVLPWASAGIFSAAGTQGDGIFTLIGGVIVALIGTANRASYATGIGALVVGALSVLIVFSVFGRLDAEFIGAGLILTGLASLFAGIAGLQLISQVSKARSRPKLLK